MFKRVEDRAKAYDLMQAGLLWWDFYGEMVPYSPHSIYVWSLEGARQKWLDAVYGPEDNFILLEE